jgi:hypothetical protein
MGSGVVARSAVSVRWIAIALSLAVVATLLPLRYSSPPTSADIVSYQRIDRTFTDRARLGVTLRTRGFIDDTCLQTT